jgi:hypothetical protein
MHSPRTTSILTAIREPGPWVLVAMAVGGVAVDVAIGRSLTSSAVIGAAGIVVAALLVAAEYRTARDAQAEAAARTWLRGRLAAHPTGRVLPPHPVLSRFTPPIGVPARSR